jgi:hypothetical protein
MDHHLQTCFYSQEGVVVVHLHFPASSVCVTFSRFGCARVPDQFQRKLKNYGRSIAWVRCGREGEDPREGAR